MASSPPRTFIVGVGMSRFEKPTARATTWDDMAASAARMAFADAGLEFGDIDAACVGYCNGDSTVGQRCIYNLGLTGVPIINVNNNCSTGSTALYTARKWVSGGDSCVLALGVEKMQRNLSQVFADAGWDNPTSKHWDHMYGLGEAASNDSLDVSRTPSNPRFNEFTDSIIKLFAYAAREHMAKYGTTKEQIAKVAHKNHKHGVNNPFAAHQKEFSMEAIMKSPPLLEPLTALEACPTGDGAAAALVCSEDFVRRRNLWHVAVEIKGQAMVTDLPSSFSESPKLGGFLSLSGFDMAQQAATKAFKEAGLTPADVQVVELHDCFASAELAMYEALGLCDVGGGGALIDSGEWMKTASGGELCKLGGRWVVNASGGLTSKGHPIGATGLGQCAECVWQLRGVAGRRQVAGARAALQHNFGIGGAAVVTVYERPPEALSAAAAHAPLVMPSPPPRAPPAPRSKL